MKKLLQFSIAFALLLVCGKAQAQTDGTLDTSFNTGTGFDNFVRSIALQPDGKILAGGWLFTSYNGTTQNRIARLDSDGTLDTSFTIGTGFNSSVAVSSIALQPDGKILVGGGFTSYNGTTQNRIARLNPDGTLDTSFTIGTGFGGSVSAIVLQPDGKILVGGDLTSYNGTTQNRIARLNSDGTLDTSFTIGTGFNNGVFAIVLQPDGKILVGGNFTSYNGTAQNRIARLNSDGTLDTSFNTGTGFGGSVSAIVLQPDGKILVGGNFTSYNGTTQNRITRLNSDGTLDTSFNIGTGFNSGVVSIALQPDGKILMGGWFTSYNGTTQNYIARLDSDGTLNTSFNIGTGFSNAVYEIALQPDGKILVGGWFTSYNGQTANRIVRLYNNVTMSVNDNELSEIKIYPNPVKDILHFSKEIHKITLTDLTGKVLSIQSNSNQINMSGYQSGVYFVIIETENGLKETRKVVKR